MRPILLIFTWATFCAAQNFTLPKINVANARTDKYSKTFLKVMRARQKSVGNDCGISDYPNRYVSGNSIYDPTMQRIVGGSVASRYRYPWQVIVWHRQAFCGGTLISKNWVITAAHCIGASTPASSIKVYLGYWNYQQWTGREKVCTVKSVTKQSFDTNTLVNDIALLNIDCGANFEFTDSYRPICLPETGNDLKMATGTPVIITGWGTTSYEGGMSRYLKEAVIAVSDHDKCAKMFAGSASRNGWLCATAKGRDTCQGDSGGPLIYYSNGKFYLHGVTSFGSGCAFGYPGVYTDVPYYRSWIRSVTGV